MMRNLNHSPFDTASQSDDWLEDEGARQVEEKVLGDLRREHARQTIAKAKDVVDVVVPTVEAEPSEEETVENIAKADRAKRQGHRVTAETLQTVREALMDEYVRLDVEHEVLINKKDEASLDRHAELLTRMNKIRERLNMTGKEIHRLVKAREASKKQPDRIKQVRARVEEQTEDSRQAAELKKALYEGKPVNARIQPESFWSRVKRSWFGGSQTEMARKTEEAEARHDTAVHAKNKAREAVHQVHEALPQYQVLSARKNQLQMKPSLWQRIFGKRDAYVNTKYYAKTGWGKQNVEKLRGGYSKPTAEEDELAEKYIESLPDDKRAA